VSFEDGRLSVPVYDREKLSAQIHFEGPALVVQFDSTTLIEPNSKVETDIFGNLIINVSEPSA
jgi:N-methylhydantoinase A